MTPVELRVRTEIKKPNGVSEEEITAPDGEKVFLSTRAGLAAAKSTTKEARIFKWPFGSKRVLVHCLETKFPLDDSWSVSEDYDPEGLTPKKGSLPERQESLLTKSGGKQVRVEISAKYTEKKPSRTVPSEGGGGIS